MQPQQREHIDTVMQLAAHGVDTPRSLVHDEVIRQSWARCVHEHRLDPTRMQEAIILPQTQVREHQDRMEDFLHIARHGLETLYHQVAGMGYVVLLTDANGVTVDFIGDLALDTSLRKAGLYLGSDWNERHAGTCGVGTAISTGQALTVHQGDHFDATHIPLTCTAAPVFDASGRVSAILDISALSSPRPKDSQHLALQMVKTYAAHIENAHFLRCFRRDWVLRLDASPQFVDVNPQIYVAVDALGRVIGHNRRAQLLLEAESAGAPVIGRRFDELFQARFEQLHRFGSAQPPQQRTVTLARSGRVLYLHATAPPALAWTPRSTQLRAAVEVPAPLAALSGGDARLDRQIERAARFANTPVSVLLTGETGTGKEYFAKALHAASARARKPFVAVNCAAIPEALIESELFGHLPGSFSGAAPRGRRGLIQEADGGTLFLDEIGDMPLPLQARLLRVLAEREVLPLGATRALPVDIRVISASLHDLESQVRAGRFRDDLYYRLNGATIALPPLRERVDFDWLVDRMLRAGEPPAQIEEAARERLRAHGWPGNLRELHNALEYARAVCEEGVIRCTDLPDEIAGPHRQSDAAATTARTGAPLSGPGGSGPAEAGADASDDAALLRSYLRAARWNVSAVARQLGVARMTLYRRMRRYGIAPPRDQGL
jgi:transcriptional regulator of acetoin/glycerol metabolism